MKFHFKITAFSRNKHEITTFTIKTNEVSQEILNALASLSEPIPVILVIDEKELRVGGGAK